MFIPPAYLVSSAYVLTVKTVSKSDQLMLNHLNDTITKLCQGVKEGGISNRKFERLYPAKDIPKWLALRSTLFSHSEAYSNLTFLLCFHHVDYAKNIDRLLVRYRAWRKCVDAPIDKSPHSQNGIDDSSALNVEDISSDLEALYRKHHDGLSLGTLLSLRLDGAPSEEQSASIVELWGDNPLPLLISAYQSAVRTRNIVDALWMKDKGAKQEAYRELKRLSHNPDPRIAASAKKVEQELRKLPAD